MSIERRMKNKLNRIEGARDQLIAIQQRRAELEAAMHELQHIEEHVMQDVIKAEEYFAEHQSSIRIQTIEIMKDIKIDVLIAHRDTTTFAAFGGIVVTAKTHPEDRYTPEVGEAIAKQRLVNKILEINYGFEF